MDYDSAWCPVCDRQIMPKRYQVPIHPNNTSSPPPPPPSPLRKSKQNIRHKQGGLVQGTGRLKLNGTIKSQPQVRLRTVIDQGPIPLYCSDECQVADITHIHRALPINFNPERESTRPSSPLPSRTFSSSSETESDSCSSTSYTSAPPLSVHHNNTNISPSVRKLAEIYNFPPLPPPAPTYVEEAPHSNPNEYNSGIMMAGRLINSFCPKPTKRQSFGGYNPPAAPREIIPGWTDGTHAWRSAVYSFSSPKNTDALQSDKSTKAYGSFAASPHRSHGVFSTLGDSPKAPIRDSSKSLPAQNQEMITKFSQSFCRRSDSRTSVRSGSPTSSRSFPPTASSHRRERSILKPGAEGKLLVPDVKLKVNNSSSTSLSSAWSGPTTSSSRRSVARSPLSVTSDEDNETTRNDSATLLPQVLKRPVVETRSWSYDNLKTYPIMQLPQKMEKRKEIQVVDGVEVEVEVEVPIIEPLKRLFLFPAPLRA